MKLRIPRSALLTLVASTASGLITAGFVHAQSTTTNASTAATTPVDQAVVATTASTPAPPAFDPTKGGHVGANGVKEVLLTGDSAAKATAAAQAAVPGGTILRVETDAEGATYEAHMTKSDGTPVTVKMDANYKVTGIENGPGRMPMPTTAQ